MWVSRICSVALLLSPVFSVSLAAAEPIGQEVKEFTETPTLALTPESVASELDEAPLTVPIMRPIAISAALAALIPEENPLPAMPLPEAQPLEASVSDAVEATALRSKALQSHNTVTALKETAVPERLVASLPAEPIEPLQIKSQEISGTVLSDPLSVIISLKDQRLEVYRGLERIETTKISSGKRGYQTLTGVFGILQKKQEHYSNLYDDAPMPWMHRLTRSGTAIHAGVVPNYPASHGCVRLPSKFAPEFYRMTEVGGKVAMLTGAMVAPKPIEHPVLVKDWHEGGLASFPVDVAVQAGAKEAAQFVSGGPSNVANRAKQTDAHWRILVTRREERDIAIGTQEALAEMGYLTPQDKFVGYLGPETKKAIRAFEKDHGLRRRGVFSERIAAKIYEAAGKGPLPDAYLFLRKGFSRVDHVPVTLKDPKKALGTHHFVYTRPSDGSEPTWIGISLEGEEPSGVLDRITIPGNMRAEISRGLTSGASFIVADKAKHSSILPEGDDFIVRTNDSAASNVMAEKAKPQRRKRTAKKSEQRKAKAGKRVAATKSEKRLFGVPSRKRTVRSISGRKGFRPFGR